MAIREIRTYPDDVLKKKAERIESIDEELLRLIDDMAETMYAAPGIGLAAPQVGVSKRLILVDLNAAYGDEAALFVIINPEIVESEGCVKSEEGCLSLPEFTASVDRFETVTVKGLDREGSEIIIPAEGLFAIALQHEIDHLEGTLLLDRASSLKREFYKKSLKKSEAKTRA